ARLRMRTDIGIGPPVEGPLFHPRQVVGWKAVAEAVALLHDGVEIAGLRLERQPGRIAHARGERGLIAAVGIETLDRRLDLRLDAEVAGRADPDEQRTGFRV